MPNLLTPGRKENVIQSSIKLYYQIEYFLHWKMLFLIFEFEKLIIRLGRRKESDFRAQYSY